MAEPRGFRLRYRVRIGRALTTDDVSRTITVAGRAVSITSQQKDQPLSETKWVILSARGFDVENEAYAFGEQLGIMMEIAALCSRLGVDVGQNKPTGWVSEEFARSSGRIRAHERIAPNVHGLLILPDDENTRIPLVEVQGKISADPAQLLGAMRELAESLPLKISAAASGVRLLNLALMNAEPLTQIVLAFSAVEALGQDETWTKAQTKLIQKLAAEIKAGAGDHDTEALEVADALLRLHRIGLRQGVKRVLSHLNLSDLQREWDRIYGLRSGVFHGTVKLTDSEIHQLANDTVNLSGRIVLSLIERDGIDPPTVARLHFSDA